MNNLKTDDEEGRARALERLEVLDTEEEVPFENIVNLIQQILKVPMCAVSLVDRDRQWFKARRGLNACETARNISFCTHAIKQPGPFIIPDALNDPRFANSPLVLEEPRIRSYAGIPLQASEGYNIGSLCAMDTKTRDFTESEIAILEQFAKTVMSELELRQIASTDHLTGALSRRAWTNIANTQFKRAKLEGRQLALAVLDLDRFKWINDHFGHSAGDIILKAISNLCMEHVRDTDSFGRIGGEEFVMLFPDTDAEGAKNIVEDLRKTFQDSRYDLGETVSVTTSIGVAQICEDDLDIQMLMERADAALYVAKKTGRNRTVMASETLEDEKTGMVA